VSARIGYLGLGSNIEPRRTHLQEAVTALPALGLELLASSSVYDTDPVGELLDQPSFLNCCLRIETALEPLELLDAVKGLERRLGRAPGGPRHGPRAIDIDILLLGEVVLHGARISLPHPQLSDRRFVLIPALELDERLSLPDGCLLADALVTLPVSEGVRWAGDPLELVGSARPALGGSRPLRSRSSCSSR
jgi:2-amino-4-hydroxy-6-hydroxymethyldihydropteridine diphosphokinase